MTCLVSAGHFFLQQPLHPTFPSLHALHRLMAATYQNPDVPALPRPVKGNFRKPVLIYNFIKTRVLKFANKTHT